MQEKAELQMSVWRQKNVLKDAHILINRTCDYVTSYGKEILQVC